MTALEIVLALFGAMATLGSMGLSGLFVVLWWFARSRAEDYEHRLTRVEAEQNTMGITLGRLDEKLSSVLNLLTPSVQVPRRKRP